jgi:Fe2+ transport system protein FeoA
MPLGVSARVAYVNASSDERHHRLTHFGVVPGATVKLHQRKPTVVVMLENSRLAMEDCIARDIYVWCSASWKKCYDDASVSNKTRKPGNGGLFRFWRR